MMKRTVPIKTNDFKLTLISDRTKMKTCSESEFEDNFFSFTSNINRMGSMISSHTVRDL